MLSSGVDAANGSSEINLCGLNPDVKTPSARLGKAMRLYGEETIAIVREVV